MILNEVVSSNIRKVGYEDNNLIVEYISGKQYKYENVPHELYEDLLKADSKGRFMNEFIKGKFKYETL